MDLRAKLARLRGADADAISLGPARGLRQRLQPMAAEAEPETDDALFERIGHAGQVDKSERIARLRALIDEVSARTRRRERQETADSESAAERALWPSVATAHGPLHALRRELAVDHHHGRVPLHACLRPRHDTLSALLCDPGLAPLDVSAALFLDTETTGLAGGTGTVAFLVGLARFEAGALCIEQLIVPQLGAEAPVLARLAECVAAASCVITYNGKSFDWPLLRTRFVLARLPVPPLPLHIDLLHVARRIFKVRLPSLRLGELERELMAFEREHDVPSAEIPARYFEYLRGAPMERLAPVLEHNQNDLIALAALLGVIVRAYEGITETADAHDALALGRLALRARDFERARAFALAAVGAGPQGPCAQQAHVLHSEVHRQLGDAARACVHLNRALACTRDADSRAALHLALAKLYEHERGELALAFRHARHTEPSEGALLHGRRMGRLYRRLLREAASTRRRARAADEPGPSATPANSKFS